MRVGLPLMKRVLAPLAKSVLLPLNRQQECHQQMQLFKIKFMDEEVQH